MFMGVQGQESRGRGPPWFGMAGDLPRLLLGGLAAFAAYFAMYAFRKPLAVAGWTDVGFHPFGLDYKTALVIVQVVGYAASKLIGIRMMSSMVTTVVGTGALEPSRTMRDPVTTISPAAFSSAASAATIGALACCAAVGMAVNPAASATKEL